MDAERAEQLLAAVSRDAPDGLILWRGDDLCGSDVDVLVMPQHAHEVSGVLRDAGLSPAVQDDGRILWRSPNAGAVVIDAMPASSWPTFYPSLDGLLSRSTSGSVGLRVSSAEDRLLIFAAEAVAGRPVEHVLRKSRPLLSAPGAAERLRAVAAAERAGRLAELISAPERLAPGASGRLRWSTTLRLALGCARARAALATRLAARLGFVRRASPPRSADGTGALIALSGIDGSGKSTTALEVARRIEHDGRSAWVSWSRLAADTQLLDLIAAPVRRVLRPRGSIADPIAAGREDQAGHEIDGLRGRGPVAWAWVVVVAAINVLSCRRIARIRKRGLVVICDRWLIDALVDLEARYGRHRVAEWVLRRGVPRADLEILLEIDARTSAARKPGDQAERVLEGMTRRYAEAAAELGFTAPGSPAQCARVRVDATDERTEVVAAVEQHIQAHIE